MLTSSKSIDGLQMQAGTSHSGVVPQPQDKNFSDDLPIQQSSSSKDVMEQIDVVSNGSTTSSDVLFTEVGQVPSLCTKKRPRSTSFESTIADLTIER